MEISLVACVGTEVVGHLSLYPYPEPRRRHSGHFGMAVRDDWRRQGVGTKLIEAALDLADNWLGLTRLDLRVFATTKRLWGSTGNSASRWRARIEVRLASRRVRRRPRHGSPQAPLTSANSVNAKFAESFTVESDAESPSPRPQRSSWRAFSPDVQTFVCDQSASTIPHIHSSLLQALRAGQCGVPGGGDSRGIGAGICKILQTNFREFLFHALR